MIAPAVGEMKQLHEQASMGDIQGILKQLQKIESSGRQYTAFITKVRNMAKDYNMKEIRDFIEKFLKK